MQKEIKVSEISDKGPTIRIVDETGKKYVLWKEWQGAETPPYETFQRLGTKTGSLLSIEFVTKKKNFKGTDYDENTIKNIIGHVVVGYEAPKPTTQTNSAPRSNSYVTEASESKEDFGRRLAIHGMVNGMLSSGKSIEEVLSQLTDLLTLEDAINEVLAGKTDKPLTGNPFIDEDPFDMAR